MEIKVNTQIPSVTRQLNYQNKKQNSLSNYVNNSIDNRFINDKFIGSKDNIKTLSFKGKFTSFINSLRYKNEEQEEPSTGFTSDLAYGIKKVTENNVPAKNLTNVLSPQEFKEILPYLHAENFIDTPENREKGIYCAELDYQSNFSSGKENVFEILDKAATYAQEYYKKTGKNFIFALTDRDSLEGLQHAIRIFGENPEKYKHLKLLPGLKLSFAHKAPTSIIGYENSEMLIYGLNPYSKNVTDFVDNLIKKRRAMTINFIRDVNTLYPDFAYSIIEFAEQNKLKYMKGYTVSNLYWRAREYAETKGGSEIKGTSKVPDEIVNEAQNILDNLSKVYVGSDEKGYSAVGSSIIKDSEVNQTIKKVFEKYSTHYDKTQNKVISAAENLYEDMIECFGKEPEKPVMALASPFYFSHYFEKPETETFNNVTEFFNSLQKDSDGMLLGFESVSPTYEKDAYVTPEIIQKFNKEVRENTNLKEVGGSLINKA